MMLLVITLLISLVILFKTYVNARKVMKRNQIEATVYKELNSLYVDYALLFSKNSFSECPTIKKLIEKDIHFLTKIDKNLDLRNIFVGRAPTEKKEKIEFDKLESELKNGSLEVKNILFASIKINLKIMKLKNKRLYNALQIEIGSELIKEVLQVLLKNFIKKNRQYVDNFKHEKKLESILSKFGCC